VWNSLTTDQLGPEPAYRRQKLVDREVKRALRFDEAELGLQQLPLLIEHVERNPRSHGELLLGAFQRNLGGGDPAA
jgi:hypothetical protein